MTLARNIGHVASMVLSADLGDGFIWRATKYITPNEVISATRIRYKEWVLKKEQCPVVVLRVGKPNYAEREFIKTALRAGEPFPIKKVQIRRSV